MRGAVNVLDADQADEVGVLLMVVEGQLGEAADRGDRVQVLDVELLLGLPDHAVRALEDGREQLLLAAEVVLEQAEIRAGCLGDVARAGPVEALRAEHLERGLQDALPCAPSGERLGARTSPALARGHGSTLLT